MSANYLIPQVSYVQPKKEYQERVKVLCWTEDHYHCFKFFPIANGLKAVIILGLFESVIMFQNFMYAFIHNRRLLDMLSD